jgi:hypothetical protein
MLHLNRLLVPGLLALLIPACVLQSPPVGGDTAGTSPVLGAALATSVIPPELELKPWPAQLKGSVRAARFGLVPGTGRDAGPALSRLLAAATPGTVILLQKGRYDVWSDRAAQRPWQQSNSDPQASRNYGILAEGLSGVTLDGTGSEFIFHGTQTGIGLAFCTNVTLRGFSLDWQRPELSQGTVLESGPDYVVVKMHADTPAAVEAGRLVFPGEGWVQRGASTMEFDPKTGGPAYQRADLPRVGAATLVSPGVFRLETKARYKVGNAVIFRHGARTHCVLLVHRCQNTVLEKVDAYASCGLGFLVQHSDGARFTDVRYLPKPGSGRLFSSRDDGLQVSGCKGLIEVNRCVFEGMMDDPINVHGTYLPVTGRVDERTLRCRFGQGQSIGQAWWADPGDRVDYVFRDSVLTHGTNVARSFRLLNDHEAEIVLAAPVPAEIGPGWVLENMTMHPTVQIRNSRFGNQRARGVLFTTPRPVLLEGNTFYTSGSAVLINGDANGWFESGVVRNAIIRHNTFINCNQAGYQFGEAIISIDPVVNKPEPGSYSHSNIRIENNVFKTFDAPVLYAESVDGLSFTGNTIERTHDHPAWHPRKVAVTLDRCRGVTLRGTRLVGEVLGPLVKATGTLDLNLDREDALKLQP